MKIRTTLDPKPIPNRGFDWSAVDESTYDGAEDSEERHMVGYGPTEAEAIEDLLRIHREEAEYREDMALSEAERRDGGYDTLAERMMDLHDDTMNKLRDWVEGK